MTDLYLKTETITESHMKTMFPQTGPVSIATAAVGKNEQAVRIWIVVGSYL